MVTYRNMRTGRIVEIGDAQSIELMDAASKWIRVEDETLAQSVGKWAEVDEPDTKADGIYHRGGAWFDVTVAGVTQIVQGRANAEDRYGEMGGI